MDAKKRFQACLFKEKANSAGHDRHPAEKSLRKRIPERLRNRIIFFNDVAQRDGNDDVGQLEKER